MGTTGCSTASGASYSQACSTYAEVYTDGEGEQEYDKEYGVWATPIVCVGHRECVAHAWYGGRQYGADWGDAPPVQLPFSEETGVALAAGASGEACGAGAWWAGAPDYHGDIGMPDVDDGEREEAWRRRLDRENH